MMIIFFVLISQLHGLLLSKRKQWNPSSSRRSIAFFAEKVRIRLTTNVPGTGRKGEIVSVNPSFFVNSLYPKKLAVKVTDQEMARLKKVDNDLSKLAQELGKRINQKELFFIKHKMGPNGQLFGSISPKEVEESLFAQIEKLENDFKQLKDVELVDIFECDSANYSKGSRLSDVRKKGVYIVTLQLHHSLPPFAVYLNVVSDT